MSNIEAAVARARVVYKKQEEVSTPSFFQNRYERSATMEAVNGNDSRGLTVRRPDRRVGFNVPVNTPKGTNEVDRDMHGSIKQLNNWDKFKLWMGFGG